MVLSSITTIRPVKIPTDRKSKFSIYAILDCKKTAVMGIVRHWSRLLVNHHINLTQMVNLYCSVIFRTYMYFLVYNHYLNHYKICQNLDIWQPSRLTNIINYFHNYEHIISFIKVCLRALNLGLYRKSKISMSVILNGRLRPSCAKFRMYPNCFKISIPKLPCIPIFKLLSLI